MINAWFIALSGIWLIAAPFVRLGVSGNAWNDWIFGAIIAIAGYSMTPRRAWQGWLCGLGGSWLFIAGFLPSLLAGPGLWWNDILLGAGALIIGLTAVMPPGRRVETAALEDRRAA